MRESDLEVAKRIEREIRDPVYFCREILGCTPWEGQEKILRAIATNKKVAVKSCHSAGKDWLTARAAIWFMFAHNPSLVITTAPSDRQCREILWKEIMQAEAMSRWPLGGQPMVEAYRLSKTQSAIGFTSSPTQPNRFQGMHCTNMLAILDESAGLEENIYMAADACLTSENSRRLEIGNPTDPSCSFAESFSDPRIKKISISAFDTPNFKELRITENDIRTGAWEEKITGPLPAPYLITPEWVADKLAKWGWDSPLFQSRVLAEFPQRSEDSLIPYAWIEAAIDRTSVPTTPDILSVDVARYGGDMNVVTRRVGNRSVIIDRFGECDTMETAGRVRLKAITEKSKAIVVDIVGIGAGVADRLREFELIVIDFNGGESAIESEMYCNARTEAYWALRRAFEKKEASIPKDAKLIEQLKAIRYKFDSKGRIKIEEKDELKKRLGYSPDEADSLSMCYSPYASMAIPMAYSPGRGVFNNRERPSFREF